ncbi:DUF2513 domain-containing protein, partial [Melissococcus plutonius]
MKLNHNCIRDIMLFIEEYSSFRRCFCLNDFLSIDQLSDYNEDTIKYTLAKLGETNFLNADSQWANHDLIRFNTNMLTWEGHKFLDTIRDDKVWADTTSIVSKFSSVSISMVENIASNVIA